MNMLLCSEPYSETRTVSIDIKRKMFEQFQRVKERYGVTDQDNHERNCCVGWWNECVIGSSGACVLCSASNSCNCCCQRQEELSCGWLTAMCCVGACACKRVR